MKSFDPMLAPLCSGYGQWHSPNNTKDPQPFISTTIAEIQGGLESPASVDKARGQWAIFSTLQSRVHAEQRERGQFVALWADIDDAAGQPFTDMAAVCGDLLPGFIAYTSRSATADNQKARVIVPLTEPVSGSDFVLLQRVLNNKLQDAGITPDRATERAGQVCYLPNRGAFWGAHVQAGALDPAAWATELAAEQQREIEAQKALEAQREQARLKAAQRMATGCRSPIDAFNAEYPLELMFNTFGYPGRGNRWLSPNSESGVPGVTISEDGRKWFSLHGSDSQIGRPTETGTMGDAFDLFTYYQHGGDRDAAIKDAGDMFTVDGVTITQANQRDFMQRQDAADFNPPAGLEQKPLPAFFTPIGELITDLKAPSWVIKGVLEQDSLAVTFGEPGHGKSFLAMDMAASIATGTDWHGHRTTPGAVFYIAGEGQNGLARRFKAWEIARGVSLKDAPLAISSTPIGLDDPESAVKVKEAVTAMAEQLQQAPALIVVDTLARNFAGDENSTKDMNTFVRAMDYLRRDWDASILIVHHTGKDTTKGARGSSVLKAAIDCEYSATMDENKVIALQSHKMKEGELPPLMAFRLEGVKLPIVDEDLNDLWSCAPVLMDSDYQPPKRGSQGAGKNQTMALACLAELYRAHQGRLEDGGQDPETALVSIEDWRKSCEEAGIKRQRFNEVKKSLDEQGRIEITHPYVTAAA